MATIVNTIPIPQQRSFLADAARVLGSNVAIVVLTFVSGVLIARKLGPAGQGTVTALLVYPILFTSMAEMGIRQATVYHTGKKLFADRDIVGVILALLIVSGLVGMATCGLILTTIAPIHCAPLLIGLAVCYVPVKLTISYASGYFLGKEYLIRFNRVNWLAEVIRLAAILLLVWMVPLGVTGAVTANLIGIGITAGYTLWLLSRAVPLSIKWQTGIISRLLSIGVVYAISLLVLQLNYQVHVLMLAHMSTTAQVGIYSLGSNLVIALWQLPNAVGIVVFARSANMEENAAFTRKVLRLVRMAFVVVVAAAALLYLTAGWLVPLIFGNDYLPSIAVIRTLLPGVVFFTIFRVLNMDLAGRGKPALVLISTLPALAIAVVLNILLVPRYGALGAAMAASSGLGFGTLVMIGIYCRYTGVSVFELLRYRVSDFTALKHWRRDTA